MGLCLSPFTMGLITKNDAKALQNDQNKITHISGVDFMGDSGLEKSNGAQPPLLQHRLLL